MRRNTKPILSFDNPIYQAIRIIGFVEKLGIYGTKKAAPAIAANSLIKYEGQGERAVKKTIANSLLLLPLLLPLPPAPAVWVSF
jgi:hypothetical protein